MQIIRKIVENGSIVGYSVDFDGNIFDCPSRCLYYGDWFHALRSSGYKFYSYNPDEITCPDGKCITELPEVELSSIEEDAWESMQGFVMEALPDAVASKYYEAHNTEFSFRDPVEIQIATREELVAYLNQVKSAIYNSGSNPDVRPLNSFVAKEALFTLDELHSDPEVRALFRVIQMRHKLRDYNVYMKLVNWLCEQGVLNSTNPSYIEFLTAYYAWGFDGIRDDCSQVSTKLAANGAIYKRNEDYRPTGHYLSNKTEEFLLWDTNENLRYLNFVEPTESIRTFDKENLVLPSPDDLFKARREKSGWKSKYLIYRGYVHNTSDRLYMDYFSQNGYPFHIKITHNSVYVYSNTKMVYSDTNFAVGSIKYGVWFGLDDIRSQDDYYLWNLALIKSHHLCKNKVIPSLYNNTCEMYIGEGLGPKAAIHQANINIKINTFESSESFYDSLGKKPIYLDAIQDYCSPVDSEILAIIGGDEEDYEDKGYLIDVMSDLLPQMIEDCLAAPDAANKHPNCEEFVKYYDNLSFVHEFFNGSIMIDSLGDGYKKDAGSLLIPIAKIIISCLHAEGVIGNKIESENIIMNFDSLGLVDLNKVLKVKDAKHKGCLEDMAALRCRRTASAYAWCYCTKVFRELSNAPISKQRHYLMEIVQLENEGIKQAFKEAVLDAIPEDDNSFEVDLMRDMVGDVAAKIFFGILDGSIDDSYLKDGNYVITHNFDTLGEIKIVISDYLYSLASQFDVTSATKYITLFDWVKYELGDNGGYSLYMVNANITPWRVSPKKGYTINEYNFAVNWLSQNALNSMADTLGEEWCTALATTDKSCTALGRLNGSAFIPSADFDLSGMTPEDYDIDTIDAVLSDMTLETPALYYRRWMLYKKRASEEGKRLISIPLKSDILYGSLSWFYGEEVKGEAEFSDDLDIHPTAWLESTERNPLKWIKETPTAAIAANTVRKRSFDIFSYDMENVVSWSKLLRGAFVPSAAITVSNTKLEILVGDKLESLPFSSLNAQALEKLADKGILFKLGDSSYFAKAYNGSFVLEV